MGVYKSGRHQFPLFYKIGSRCSVRVIKKVSARNEVVNMYVSLVALAAVCSLEFTSCTYIESDASEL